MAGHGGGDDDPAAALTDHMGYDGPADAACNIATGRAVSHGV